MDGPVDGSVSCDQYAGFGWVVHCVTTSRGNTLCICCVEKAKRQAVPYLHPAMLWCLKMYDRSAGAVRQCPMARLSSRREATAWGSTPSAGPPSASSPGASRGATGRSARRLQRRHNSSWTGRCNLGESLSSSPLMPPGRRSSRVCRLSVTEQLLALAVGGLDDRDTALGSCVRNTLTHSCVGVQVAVCRTAPAVQPRRERGPRPGG